MRQVKGKGGYFPRRHALTCKVTHTPRHMRSRPAPLASSSGSGRRWPHGLKCSPAAAPTLLCRRLFSAAPPPPPPSPPPPPPPPPPGVGGRMRGFILSPVPCSVGVSECRAVAGRWRGGGGAVAGRCRLTLASGCRDGAGPGVGQCRGFLTLPTRTPCQACRSVGQYVECRSVDQCRACRACMSGVSCVGVSGGVWQ